MLEKAIRRRKYKFECCFLLYLYISPSYHSYQPIYLPNSVLGTGDIRIHRGASSPLVARIRVSVRWHGRVRLTMHAPACVFELQSGKDIYIRIVEHVSGTTCFPEPSVSCNELMRMFIVLISTQLLID